MERLTTSISTVDVTSIIADTDLTSLSVSPASYVTNSWTSNINTRILTLASSNSNTIGEPFTLIVTGVSRFTTDRDSDSLSLTVNNIAASQCDLDNMFPAGTTIGGTIDAGTNFVVNDCDTFFGTTNVYFSGTVTLECEGNDLFSFVADTCERRGCDLEGDPNSWGVDGEIFQVTCDLFLTNEEWVDTTVVQVQCVQPNTNVQAFPTRISDNCVAFGCDLTGDPFGLGINEGFIEVGDTFQVTCENADPLDEYFSGEVTYTCIDHATVSRGSLDDCVLLGCDLEGDPNNWEIEGFYELNDIISVDCNLHDPTDKYFSGLADYQCIQANSNVNGEFVLIDEEDCYLLGCHFFPNNSFELVPNNTEFVFFEINDTFVIDCNIADPGDEYFSGVQEYICESQDFVRETNFSDCVLLGCDLSDDPFN